MSRFKVCWFESASHLEGSQRSYRRIKSVVLSAGRYSIFEATQSQRDARLFMKLDKDPEVETFEVALPWIGVRKRT